MVGCVNEENFDVGWNPDCHYYQSERKTFQWVRDTDDDDDDEKDDDDERNDDHDGTFDSRTLAEKPIWVSGGNGPEILSPSPRLAWGNNIHAWIFELLTGPINLVSGQSFWLPMMSKMNKTFS